MKELLKAYIESQRNEEVIIRSFYVYFKKDEFHYDAYTKDIHESNLHHYAIFLADGDEVKVTVSDLMVFIYNGNRG